MAGRPSNRDALIESALAEFSTAGFAATSVADLTGRAGMSKAAFVYHFDSKDALLVELATPLLDELDQLIDRHADGLASGPAVQTFLGDYLDVLLAHASTVEWIDGDQSVLHHSDLGPLLADLNERARSLLVGDRPSPTRVAQASAVLGMLWRPVRNLPEDEVATYREGITELAAGAVEHLRKGLPSSGPTTPGAFR